MFLAFYRQWGYSREKSRQETLPSWNLLCSNDKSNYLYTLTWSHRALLVLHPAYIYMQVQKFCILQSEVWVMFKTKFLSGQATRRLTYTKYGQSTPSEHTCWSKKIENNQVPYLISHSHTENVFCLSLQHLVPEPRPELEWTCPTSSFLEELQCHLRLTFLYSDDRILALEP